MSAPGDGAQPPVYYEPARSYATVWALLGLLLGGFVADLALGGGFLHVWAWLIAIALVVGVSSLATHAARTVRSITVTPTELQVGEHVLGRESIVGCTHEVDPLLPVLGQTVHEGLPHGTPGLTLHLLGDGVVVVPTRRPHLLAQALDVSLEPGQSRVRAAEVRAAEPDDLAVLPDIDQRAEALFRVSGLELPETPFPVSELDDAKAIFVAGRPAVGFAWVNELDGLAHLAELAVIPGRMHAGLGTALLAAACNWAAADGYPAITLTTFAGPAWNAPFYAARGFATVDDLSPGLARLRESERAAGLDAVGARVVMRRELTRGS
ncbi:MAG: GNAT family N-acetyltransferase [Jatrophihabitantaceae bacterium]